jgi:molecular chaperone HtpG
MQITPDQFLNILKADKTFAKSILDIEDKIERIITNQPPIFFGQYTDHGINHFRDTLRMALHLVNTDETERKQGEKAVVEYLSPLNVFILSAAVLFHDLGMHIHFNGFRQLINGFYDDVRVEFFNDLTWKEEWDNFMIEAKRFSGRERINLFGDEQATIKDIDFSKNTVDSDLQKQLIGEFIRRHHGRLAHEIALKGFPVKDNDVISFANDIQTEYKDIFGLIARSHSMNVRNAMEYVEEMFPGDPHFPYSIEVPFLMCVLRIADYFQIDNSRTNAFLIKMKSFTSPFSLNEHRAHLATEYFKTDEKDPETLYVDAKPKDGLMYTKLLRLFDDIQKELDTSFAIIGEMYGRHKTHFKLRYRRIKSNLRNRKVIAKYPYVPDTYKFEADTDLFKLLVGPLYGYEPTYGVREMIQNAVDACIELQYKLDNTYKPVINISIEETENREYVFKISDNGKGMSLGEIKNYYLKAGASFRNSTEWKMDFENDDNTPAIRRTGKFGIGVLASFLVGDSIQVTTRRYSDSIGYSFTADLSNEFIEVIKNKKCNVGTTIVIKINREIYDLFRHRPNYLTQWYIPSYPVIKYFINATPVWPKTAIKIDVVNGKQNCHNGITIKHKDFDDIIWTYGMEPGVVVNGIPVSGAYDYYERTENSKVDLIGERSGLKTFPFVSIIDRNNMIDFALNRNNIKSELPFMDELIQSCKLDYLYNLLFKPPFNDDQLEEIRSRVYDNGPKYELRLKTSQFGSHKIYGTSEGYFLYASFFNPIIDELKYYHVFVKNPNHKRGALLSGAFCDLLLAPSNSVELDYTKYSNDDLLNIQRLNNAVSVHEVTKPRYENEEINYLLRKHLGEPRLIPYDWDSKIAYVKSCSEELQRHIQEARGIKLD